MELPTELRLALDAELQSVPSARLKRAVNGLVERYRAGSTASGESLLVDDDDVAAYAAYRMPATFAAISAALEAFSRLSPEVAPASLLDVGAGAGAGLWAAAFIWPSLERATLIDRDGRMIALGRRIAAGADPVLRDAAWRAVDLLDRPDTQRHDIVLAAYVLNEIPERERLSLLDYLWSKAAAALIIVEPGTPVGFEGIRAARDHLLRQGAHVIAPCPHDLACPMQGGDWCHFSTRVGRSRIHRQIKDAALPYEDEKFSYVAVAPAPGGPIAGRVVRHPQMLKKRVQVELCTPAGLATATYTKGKQRHLYRIARDLKWGDALLPEDLTVDSHPRDSD